MSSKCIPKPTHGVEIATCEVFAVMTLWHYRNMVISIVILTGVYFHFQLSRMWIRLRTRWQKLQSGVYSQWRLFFAVCTVKMYLKGA